MTRDAALQLFKHLTDSHLRELIGIETDVVLRSPSHASAEGEYAVEFRCDKSKLSELARFLETIQRLPDRDRPVWDGNISIRSEGEETTLYVVVTTFDENAAKQSVGTVRPEGS